MGLREIDHIDPLHGVTKDVVEAAGETMVIAPA